VGLSHGYDQIVLRGDPAGRSFAAFYLRQGELLAVDAINSPREFAHAKKLVAARVKIAPETLRDASVDLGAIAGGKAPLLRDLLRGQMHEQLADGSRAALRTTERRHVVALHGGAGLAFEHAGDAEDRPGIVRARAHRRAILRRSAPRPIEYPHGQQRLFQE